MSRKKLFLLDAMALIYRAYYALNKNPRISSTGLNTSAILGFANTLFDVLRNESPSHIGVAFDTMAPTFRKEGFELYKAHREETPEDIIRSIPYIQELIRGFNIPVLSADGYEADDVIGTLAKKAEQAGFEVFMMTSDKDFGQLVSDHVFIYKPAKFGVGAEILGVREVCEKFHIQRPEQVTDILGLWGDASDNIPGIPGFGEVTAKKLIAEYDTIENLIEKAATIPNEKWKEKVITHKDQALLSKQLATIILDVPVPFDPDALSIKHPDEQSLRQLFTELEFRTFAQRLFTWFSLQKPLQESTASFPPGQAKMDLFSGEVQDFPGDTGLKTIHDTPHSYILVDNAEKRAELLKKLSPCSSVCFDTETTGIDPNQSELVGISFAVKPYEAFFVPVPPDRSQALEVAGEFKPLLENETVEKIGQNIKFDMSILKWYGINVKGPLFDTMLAHYIIQPDLRHNMDFLSETYLGYKPVSIESLIGKKGSAQLSMRTVDQDVIKDYAAEDADVTFQLKEVFAPMLTETDSRNLFDSVECPLIPVLASMEAEGVRIDANVLKDYSRELGQDIRNLEKEIFTFAGTEFNVASPKQLGEILFEKLGIVDNPKKTRTRQYSTSEDVLSKLMHRHPIIPKILEYRSLTKLKSTYVDVLPALVSQRDGRVHTSYNQAVAATGRLSSNNPNLQNIPIRTEKGREIRKAFVAGNEEYVLLSADYSQIELRIVASISEDRGMIEDFMAGQDIHQATAAKIYHCKPDEVSREMRRNAKAVNFGIIYGMSSFGLSERLNIPRREATDIISQYFRQYPGIKTYMEHTIAFAKTHGYVETLMKRRRYLRDINSGNATVRGFAERNAINAPIQGTAADMIKIAMVRIFEEFNKRNLKSKMILQVHDELVFDTFISEKDEITKILQAIMPSAIPLKVPVVVDISTGKNWLEAH